MSNLRQAAQQALEDICGAKLCEFNSMSSRQEMVRLMDSAITALRAALAEPEQEPVAWIHEDELPSSYPYDLMFPYSKVNGVRLFPVFGPSPQRKPLTDEEILRISLDTPVDLYACARAIERHHGIGEQHE